MLSSIHQGVGFAAVRNLAHAQQSSATAEVGEDGDKGASAPVSELDTQHGAKESSRAAKAGDRKPAKGADNKTGPRGSDGESLDQAEVRQLETLRTRDREVRAHEAAHVAAGGRYVQGGPTYTFHTGPDGRRYAIGGEVSISTGKESTPEATLAKAQVIRAAAQAPASPSGADRAVAAAATHLEASARTEIREEKAAEVRETKEDTEAKAEEAQAAQEAAKAGSDDEAAPLLGESDGQPAGEQKGLAARPTQIPAAYTANNPPSGAASGGGLLNRIA